MPITWPLTRAVLLSMGCRERRRWDGRRYILNNSYSTIARLQRREATKGIAIIALAAAPEEHC
jgi:hypothetical protein